MERRLLSCAVILAWMVGLAAPLLLPHSAAADSACGDVVLGPFQPGGSVDAATVPAGAEHCDLCHLQRIVRGVFAGAVRTAQAFDVAPASQPPATRLVPCTAARQLPSRAPPALL